jgi:N-acetylmuramoyl-L-alanine amidase
MGVRSAYGFFAGWKRMAALAAVASLGAAALAQGASAGSTPVAVRFGGDKAATRVVLDLSQSVSAKVASNKDGAKQLIVDFPKLDAGEAEGRGQGLVNAWTLEKNAGGSRLTLSLNRAAVVDRRFLLAPAEGVKNYRYVIDLKAPDARPAMDKSPVMVASTSKTVEKTTPAVDVQPIVLKKVIVIDAGHGGHDPGALGANVQEKHVTLAAAKALKTRLEKTGRYRVVLTRGDDVFVPLENRVQIARRAGADLFISLHADAGENRLTRGASVYTLSDEGVEKVARNVNGNSDWFIDVDMPGGQKAVKQILFDLTQRATLNKSAGFAEVLIDHVGDEAPLLTRAHRDARYVVLFAPDVPAVLLEMGFITNAADEKLLTDSDQRERLTVAIADAIDEYFKGEARIAAR